MTHLTREQRYAIYLGRQAKRTQKQIADEIGVSQSTVSRELRRGSKDLIVDSKQNAILSLVEPDQKTQRASVLR